MVKVMDIVTVSGHSLQSRSRTSVMQRMRLNMSKTKEFVLNSTTLVATFRWTMRGAAEEMLLAGGINMTADDACTLLLASSALSDDNDGWSASAIAL